MSSVVETKKEQILHLAQKDPFLKIEEIAASAETTPRYVRTILSEAKISLMHLRRAYARNMERRLGIDVTLEKSTDRVAEVLVNAGNIVGANQFSVLKFSNPKIAKILGAPEGEPLLKVSRCRVVNGRPFFLTEVVTHLNLLVGDAMADTERPLRQSLGLEIPGKTRFLDRSVEVEPADEYAAAVLGLKMGHPVFRLGNIIETEGRKVGVEYNVVDAYRLKLVFPGEADYRLQLVEKV